jgi:hypothetical protein
VGTARTSFECPPAGLVGPLGVTLSPLRTQEVVSTSATGIFCTNLPPPVPTQPVAGAFGVGTARRIAERGTPPGDLRDRQPHDGTVSATFCIPATGNGLVDNQANLPGPGAVSIRGDFQLR